MTWNSIKRKPKQGRYLFYCDSGETVTGRIGRIIETDMPIIGKVTHWARLPKPPNGKQKGYDNEFIHKP